MNARPVRFGALSLLLCVVVIVLAVLAVLSYATAHASLALADKQAEHLATTYADEAIGQEWLADIDGILQDVGSQGLVGDQAASAIEASLPAGTTYSAGTVSAVLDCGDGRTLSVAVRIDDDLGYQVTEWKSIASWEPDQTIGDLWTGAPL